MYRYRRRVIFLFLCAGLPYGGLLLRLAHLQVVRGAAYAYAAFRQHADMLPLEEYARGSILDTHGISLTGEHWEQRVAVFPALMREKQRVTAGLAALLGVPAAVVAAQVGRDPVCLPYRLTAEQAAAVRKASWPGVVVVPYRERYGARPLAVPVVGHLGRIGSGAEYRKLARGGKPYAFDDYVGRKGCEYYYEYLLKGTMPCAAAGIYREMRGVGLSGALGSASKGSKTPGGPTWFCL
ncbi:hypothetical protein [Thermodesulfitimonas sp.]